MKTWVQWAVGTGLVVAAWGVAALTPPEDAREASFVVRTGIGEETVARNVVVTVTSVVRADRVTTDDWSADGNWVVVNLTSSAVLEETGAGLYLATLTIGGRTFSASERPDSFDGQPLAVGIPRSGSLAFELPPDVFDMSAVLSLGESPDPRLDAVIELPLVLGTLPHQASVELAATRWTNG